MLHKLIILLVFILIANSIYSQPADCFKFKEGKFRIADTRLGAITVAERKGGYQTESSEALKTIIRFRINWQTDCNYTLTLDKIIRNENKIDIPASLRVQAKIIAVSGKSYTQEISSSITNGAYTVEVTKLD
jgi:hypothetical protein